MGHRDSPIQSLRTRSEFFRREFNVLAAGDGEQPGVPQTYGGWHKYFI